VVGFAEGVAGKGFVWITEVAVVECITPASTAINMSFEFCCESFENITLQSEKWAEVLDKMTLKDYFVRNSSVLGCVLFHHVGYIVISRV
jgi:hypothetical protein